MGKRSRSRDSDFDYENVIPLNKKTKKTVLPFTVPSISPIKRSQKHAFDQWQKGQNLVLHGTAGTGKTFISLYLALKELEHNSELKKIYLVRSAVPSRDLGFMPGTLEQKTKMYEGHFQAMCTEIFGRGDAYELLKKKNIVQFVTTSFLRGVTLRDAIIIVDEVQNMVYEEINTIMTRVGRNSRVIVAGDTLQNDLRMQKGKQKSGVSKLLDISMDINTFSRVEFDVTDIVRSGFVKQWIMANERYA